MRNIRWILAWMLAIAAPAAAAVQPSLDSGTVLDSAERLEPGEFLWAPEVAPRGPVLVVINRTTQRLVVYRNGIPIGISTVSTGRPGYRTPTGIFTVLQKRVEHYSSIYDNAPMPYMQRLTWGGVALHAGELPGYAASHGCIRLPRDFAPLLYGVTAIGTTVVVTDRPALPAIAPAPQLLLSTPARAVSMPAGETVWNPQRAPTGPVSIVVSAADRRAVVLRNGQVIGSAPVEIDGRIEAPSAYMLESADAQGPRWLRIALPGQPAEPPSLDRGRIRVVEPFRRAVLAILEPGATVVITGDRIQPGGPAPILEGDAQPR